MSLERERAPAPPADLDGSETLFARMLPILLFEDRILELFDEGTLTGTTHTCAGQEAVAVAAAGALGPGHAALGSILIEDRACVPGEAVVVPGVPIGRGGHRAGQLYRDRRRGTLHHGAGQLGPEGGDHRPQPLPGS